MTRENLLHAEVTDGILQSYYGVYNTLGYGFLEKVYENALRISLEKEGFSVQQQAPLSVTFENQIVGEYFADLVVNNKVIVELKAAETIIHEHEAQLLNYLKATNYQVGLLLNFGPKPEFRRKVSSS